MTNAFAEKFNCFNFLDFEYQPELRKMAFRYSLANQVELTESIEISDSANLYSPSAEVLKKSMHLAHLALGVSYLKCIGFKPLHAKISSAEASFFEKLYRKGLGEYAYINKLSNFKDLKFINYLPDSAALNLPDYCNKTVIPLGGGKDSLVTVELLKNKVKDLYLLALVRPGQENFYKKIAEIAGLPLIIIHRHLDPKMSELNKAGAYNGHVPFSSILAFCLLAIAPVLGIRNAILSNEHSANFANLTWSDSEINHQYSKSLEFESDFIDFNKSNGLKNFNYFSILRPVSELAIVKKFAAGTLYDSVFTSCNRYFATQKKLWCGECAKCCFFFILASAFMKKDRLIKILGKNLYEDQKLFPVFDELCGLSGHKPFDCVGVPEEAQLAAILASESDWKDSAYLDYLKSSHPEIFAKKEELRQLAFSHSGEHNISDEFRSLTDGYL